MKISQVSGTAPKIRLVYTCFYYWYAFTIDMSLVMTISSGVLVVISTAVVIAMIYFIYVQFWCNKNGVT